MSDRQRAAPQFDWDKPRRYFWSAAAASLLIHGAALAAVVYESTREPPEPLPMAMTVELISMSPDPGGQATGGSPASGAAGARQVSWESEKQAQDAADWQVSSESNQEVPKDDTARRISSETQDHVPDDDTALNEIVTDARTLTAAAIPTPTPKPRKPDRPAKTKAPPPPPPPPPPAPAPVPAEEPPPADPSPPNPEAGSTAQVAFASAYTKSPAGHGAGSAGARKGTRFQLGAPGNPIPKYPERARRQGYEGRVVLAVEVSEEGKPLSVRIAQSSGYSVLDNAAERTIRRWRFQAAVGASENQRALINVPITFRLKDS